MDKPTVCAGCLKAYDPATLATAATAETGTVPANIDVDMLPLVAGLEPLRISMPICNVACGAPALRRLADLWTESIQTKMRKAQKEARDAMRRRHH